MVETSCGNGTNDWLDTETDAIRKLKAAAREKNICVTEMALIYWVQKRVMNAGTDKRALCMARSHPFILRNVNC